MKILILGSGLLKDEKIKKISEKLGHGLLKARTSKEAITFGEDNQIDVVFWESSVPDIDSQQFVAVMKNSNPQCKIVVVLEPDFEQLDVMDKGIKTDYYLIKPLEKAYVENIVRMISSDIKLNNSRL